MNVSQMMLYRITTYIGEKISQSEKKSLPVKRVLFPSPLLLPATMMFLGGPVLLVLLSFIGPIALGGEDVRGVPVALFEGLIVLVLEWLGVFFLLAVVRPNLFMEMNEHELRMVSPLGLVLPSFTERVPMDAVLSVEAETVSIGDDGSQVLTLQMKGQEAKSYRVISASRLEEAATLLRANLLKRQEAPGSESSVGQAPWENI